MFRADSNRRKWLVLLLCGCVWGIACFWAALRGWSMSTAVRVLVISGALPTLFWVEDSLRHRRGTPARAYADLVLFSINGTIAVASWSARRWPGAVGFTLLSIVFVVWWFQDSSGDNRSSQP